MATWTERYHSRGKCALCGTVMWCSTSTSQVSCVVNCGAAVLSSDDMGVNVEACTDEEHETALRAEHRLAPGTVVVLVHEGGG